eukprot:SAG11_NODE_3815_length_2211_cov_1.319602_3_plen_84_part_00
MHRQLSSARARAFVVAGVLTAGVLPCSFLDFVGKGEVILVSPNLYYHTVTLKAVALSPEGIISGTCYRVERSHWTNVRVEPNV